MTTLLRSEVTSVTGDWDAASRGWRTWVANDAPAALPRFARREAGGVDGGGCLEIALADDTASFGKWISPPPAVRAGATYRCRVWQRTEGVAHPEMSAPAMLTWRGEAAPPWSRPWNAEVVDRGRDGVLPGEQLVDRRHLAPVRGGDTDGWRLLELVGQAPEGATVAELEGWLRFAPGGRGWYVGGTLEEVPAQPPRVVTLATARVTPTPGSTLEDNRRLMARLVETAADQGADVVCLPENALVDQTGLMSSQAAEPLDGPTVSLLGRVAAERRVWVVAQLPERDGHRLHNTAVLLDRQGAVAARYRKMHLTTGEWERGMVPGDGPVVAKTEIGRLGMLVCFDLHFPEVARLTALAGAEVIFGPTVGDRWPERRDAGTRAHALANGVFVVTSLVKHPSDIVDPEGRLLAQAAEPNSVAVATVDLDYKATEAGRMIGPDNGTSPGSYWPGRRRDLYGDWTA